MSQWPPAGPNQKPPPTFSGNTYDLAALSSVAITLFTCTSCLGASYCWPVVAVLLGIVGLASAKDSLDPERTRLLSWLGLGGGLLFLVFIAVVILAYIAFLVLIFALVPESQRVR
ncbi:MAG: hypothetical protein HYZ68_05440 [Chloroflexi bacterium]|nr:hypothetical protein [Chloroflexota bacterium]